MKQIWYIYLLKIKGEYDEWDEKERERKWVDIDKAIEICRESSVIILKKTKEFMIEKHII